MRRGAGVGDGGATRYEAVDNRGDVDVAPTRSAAAPLPDQDAIGTMKEDGFTPAGATTTAAASAAAADGIRTSNSGVQSPVPSRSLRPAQSGSLEVDDANDGNGSHGEEGEESAKVRHWKNSRYAVGLVELTWEDEVNNWGGKNDGRPRRNCCAELCREDVEPSCCCLALSGMVCPLLGAKRVGNMVVLKESVRVTVDSSDDEDEEDDTDEAYDAANATDEERGRMVGGTRKYRTNLDCVLGPYWPVLLFVTYPLVYGVTLLTLVKAVPNKHPGIVGVWFVASLVLCVSLFKVSCTDPGIMRRRRRPPPGADGARWRWNDPSLSYRPRSAVYDADCGCVVEEYDHVCPWTGTAIGRRNMAPFKAFVCSVFVCLIMDILLLTGAM